LARGLGSAGKRGEDCALENARLMGILRGATFYWKRDGVLHFEDEDATKFFVGFEQQEMVGGLEVEPLAKAGT